jgi:6-phosphogluconolactonase
MESSRNVLIFETGDEMANFMVERWSELSGHAIKSRGSFTAALSGGETPVLFYRRLAAEGARLQWDRIHLFFVDERFVPLDSADSNYRLLSETLLENIPIPAANIHAICTGETDPLSSARKYEEEMKGFFMLPAEGIPEFDLVMLGIGADGHTASLFPGNVALCDTRHLASAVILDKNRHDRITLTLSVINNARMVVFLVTGKTKASVFRDVVERRDHHLPASLVATEKGSLLFLADAEAAQYLGSGNK